VVRYGSSVLAALVTATPGEKQIGSCVEWVEGNRGYASGSDYTDLLLRGGPDAGESVMAV
jgi:hypothetical protein